TLETQAVFRPASAAPSAARRPEPPAPTTTTSKVWSMKGYSRPLTPGTDMPSPLVSPFFAMSASEVELEYGERGRQADDRAEDGVQHDQQDLVRLAVDVVLDDHLHAEPHVRHHRKDGEQQQDRD